MEHIKIRSLEADSEYVAAFELVGKLRQTSSKLDVEENSLLAMVSRGSAKPELTDRVAALLGESNRANQEAPDSLQSRLRVIADERRDLRHAKAIAEERLCKARYKASKAICDDVSPAYQSAVATLAAAFVTAHNAHAALLAITNELNALDVAWISYLSPMQATNIFGDNSVRIAAWLRVAASHKYIKSSDIPTELKS